jgi:hypothetical protein
LTGSRLYVARDDTVTAVSRGRLRMSGAQTVRRGWHSLVEITAPVLRPESRRSFADGAIVVLPPVVAGALTAAFAPVEAGFAVGGAVFFATSYLAPLVRRRLGTGAKKTPRSRGAEVRMLTAPAERRTFQQAVDLADRISDTWPALGELIDVPEAGTMLAEALWEIAGVLVRRQELSAVLAELSRPDFAAMSPTDRTAHELAAHLQATKAALAQVEVDLARRDASLRRAELAGRNFIREQEMREAIRAAEASLRDTPPPPLDAATELAEHTQSVLSAYRELTAAFHPPT